MTTAKRGGDKKAGKAGKGGEGRQSPPSSARAERKRKPGARGNDDATKQSLPKVGKNEVGRGKGGGRLH